MKLNIKTSAQIKRYEDGQWSELNDSIVAEEFLHLTLNHNESIRLSFSPTNVLPFIYGYIFTSGTIEAAQDILEVTLNGLNADVQTREDIQLRSDQGVLKQASFIPPRIKLPSWPQIIDLYHEFDCKCEVFKETGGTHAAALCDGERFLFFAEDVGRNNTIDKVIGMGLLNKIDLSKILLFSSGRISGEIVRKVIRARIPAIVSTATATSMGIQLAKEHAVSLIGFLRKRRFNIYSLFAEEG